MQKKALAEFFCLADGEYYGKTDEPASAGQLDTFYQLSGSDDLFYVFLIVLPLYPDTVNGFVYSVSLLNYTEISEFNKIIYFISFFSLIILGILKLIFTKVKKERFNNILTVASVVLNILIVLLFAITREVYALILVFIFLITKSLLILKYIKAS